MLFNEPKLLKSLQSDAAPTTRVRVSVLFNEPKLLKWYARTPAVAASVGFSALQRAEIAEITIVFDDEVYENTVSVLFNEPKLLKSPARTPYRALRRVSVLFNEPKLLKSETTSRHGRRASYVSVLFNEPKLLKFFVGVGSSRRPKVSVLFNEPKLLKSQPEGGSIWPSFYCFSALQRAEIAEINESPTTRRWFCKSFSALQRAEIAEIQVCSWRRRTSYPVSVLFNEPKLLKSKIFFSSNAAAA